MSAGRSDRAHEVVPEVHAQRILNGSAWPEIRGLSCRWTEGVLTVTGRVPSYYLKQVAIKAVRAADGVTRIEDRIEVER